MKIKQKALLLVALPLAFEFAFCLLLFSLVDQSEKESRQARHARELIAQDMVMQQLIVDCSSSIGYFFFVGTDQALEKYRDSVRRVPIEFKKLSDLLAAYPERLEQSRRIEGFAADLIQLQDEGIQSWRSGDRAAAFLKMSSFKNKWTRLIELMDKLVEADRSQEKGNRKSEKDLRALIKTATAAGIFGNVLICILLALAFDRSTTRRLNVLMENVKALSERKPLAEPVAGADEIAALDAVFHEMAGRLKELERTKEEFVSMVSHDLRSPLTSILMSTESWAEGVYGEVSQAGKKTALETSANVQRLINLVNTLLDFEKIEAGKLRLNCTELPVSVLLEQAEQAVRSLAESRKLKLEIVESSEEIMLLDRDRIVEVLVNLLSNAIKFSPLGGKVSLSAKIQGDDLLFAVEDHGAGIAAADLEKIFDRFYQVKKVNAESDRGFGLGLSICKKIIDEHGGRIGVNSEEGRGSCFWFTLPR
ncbi:MAG: CHASE3 domain-containing protein [Candidatus Obscuribacterales bacterium]|nr:CHASE3 domain-containing protein [Candidatus Obscuribacterales bacterium]